MEKRRFGRSGHESSIAILGAAAFFDISQDKADEVMEYVLSTEINHIDIAPSYGDAEIRLGPWLAKHRERFFLGCKTQERTKAAAAEELRRSLEKLQVDRFDLFQLHAVTNNGELDQVTAIGGALEAIIEAKEEGLLDYIGITGHGLEVPKVFLKAIDRFDFDSILFPINFILYENLNYRDDVQTLLQTCKQRDIGSMVIKHIAKGPWGDIEKTHTTWYRPFNEKNWIQKCVDFVLSQPISGICTPGDINLLPLVVDACQNFQHMDSVEQNELISKTDQFEHLFV
jgi:aryl-alcohol dehydrogenase-like predicted oxidoreductase